MNSNWNPFFVSYSISQGRTPEDQLAYDKEEWSGGCMAGFMLWADEKFREWKAASKYAACSEPANYIVRWYREEFDAWLTFHCGKTTSFQFIM